MSIQFSQKKYEEYAYVLDFVQRGKSKIIKGREGPIVQAIGEDRLILLEILTLSGVDLEVCERINIGIGKDSRTKIASVLGKLTYEDLSPDAVNELERVVEVLVKNNEKTYIDIINRLQPVTPRLHALELIPGIGKTYMNQMIIARNRSLFISFEDIQTRVGLREPSKLIAKRIIEEITGSSRINIFVGR